VRIDGLEEAEQNPDVHGENVEVSREITVQQRARDGACSKDHDLGGVGVFSGKAEGCRVLVMDLVDVLVQNSGVEHLVGFRLKLKLHYRSVQYFNIPRKWKKSSKTKNNAT
jgi:hypothetical protein